MIVQFLRKRARWGIPPEATPRGSYADLRFSPCGSAGRVPRALLPFTPGVISVGGGR